MPNSNRILTIIFRVIGAFLIVVGVLIFFLLAEEKVSATVTSATWKMERNGSYYEVYDFTYEYGDNTYTGHGDDNPSHDENGEKVFSVNVGEVYYIYVNKIK